MSATLALPQNQAPTKEQGGIIDCDIHISMASGQALDKYLPERWNEHRRKYGFRYRYPDLYIPRLYPSAARDDSWPPNGGPPGSDRAFMQEQLLDEWNIETGVLIPLFGPQWDADYGAALATALNQWVVEEWLDPEPRFRSSIVAPYEDPDLAVLEIERCVSDSRFVQIALLGRTREPFGKRKYWPLFEAAARNDLPIALHFGGFGGWSLSGAGWPSFYLEEHVGMAQVFQSQITSLVFEGVFEHFPNLKIVLVEAGFAWLPSLMWRLDRSWEMLGDEVPNIKRPPSETVREHFWISTQPIEEPSQPHQFKQMLEQLDMNDRLMFATDYPHWDFDAPDRAIPATLPTDLKQAILVDNARALYKL
ncbi:MAG: amidohydrolase family protein [Chloroflexota bacterium]